MRKPIVHRLRRPYLKRWIIHLEYRLASPRRWSSTGSTRNCAQGAQTQSLDVVRLPADRRAGLQRDGAALCDRLAGRGASLSRPSCPRAPAGGLHAAGAGDRRPRRRGHFPLARRHEIPLVDDPCLAQRRIGPQKPIFTEALRKYFGGETDPETLESVYRSCCPGIHPLLASPIKGEGQETESISLDGRRLV